MLTLTLLFPALIRFHLSAAGISVTFDVSHKKRTPMNYQRIIFSILLTLSSLAFVQAQPERLNVFIDCDCDLNYIRQELTYINHVRDQALADVQLLINDIRNGSGGRTYTIQFMGRKEFQGMRKELTYQTHPMMTNDEVRQGLTQKIALGLLTYLAETEWADRIAISIEGAPQEQSTLSTKDDPWDNWIFEVYGEIRLDKETSRSDFDSEFGFESDRVTEDWRVRTDVEFNHSESHFMNDEEEYTNVRQRHYARGSVVKSLSNHWSAGIFSGVSHSTYSNIDLSYFFRPAIEYNLFPYREVIRREITFAYKIGYQRNNYISRTIYGEIEEDLFSHSIDMEMRFRQPWGDISTTLQASTFLHDFTKNRVELDSYVSVRVYKGLAVRFSTNLDLVRDQLNLPDKDASIEDLLLRQRQIATDFEARVEVGLSYTFGSAFNNIVNTRL